MKKPSKWSIMLKSVFLTNTAIFGLVLVDTFVPPQIMWYVGLLLYCIFSAIVCSATIEVHLK